MIGNTLLWKCSLIFAVLSLLLGIAACISSQKSEQLRWASGLFLQGVLLLFVFGAAHVQPDNNPTIDPAKADRSSLQIRRGLFQQSNEVRLAGFAVAGLLLVQTSIGRGFSGEPQYDQDPSR